MMMMIMMMMVVVVVVADDSALIQSLRNTTLAWPGVVVSALASINEVNQCLARFVLRWVTVSVQYPLINKCT